MTRQKTVLLTFSAAVLLVGLYSAWQWAQHRSSGWWGCLVQANVVFDEHGQRTILSVYGVQPLSPASRAGLRPADRIASVDGSSDRLAERFRELRPGQQARLHVEGPKARDVTLVAEFPFSRPSLIAGISLNVLMGLIAFGIGAFVFYRRPDDVRALILFIVTSVYAIARFGKAGPTYLYPLYLETSMLPAMLLGASSLIFFPSLLHFCLVFPARRPALERHPRLLRWVYGLPAVCAAGFAAFLFFVIRLRVWGRGFFTFVQAMKSASERLNRFEAPVCALVLAAASLALWVLASRAQKDARTRSWRTALLDSPGRTALMLGLLPIPIACSLRLASLAYQPLATASMVVLAMGYMLDITGAIVVTLLVFPVAACVALWRSYRESGGEEKRQLRWPLWGVSVGVGGFLLVNILIALALHLSRVPKESLTNAVFSAAGDLFPDASLLMIPVGIAFGVLKHRLMDIDVYIRRTAIYGSLTGLLGIVYVVVVGALGSVITGLVRLPGHWVPIGSTLLVALLFVPVRNRLQGFMDRRFYRRSDYAAALRDLVARLSERLDRQTLLRSAVESVQEALHARNAALWLESKSEPAFTVQANVGVPDELAARAIDKAARLVDSLAAPGPPRWDAMDAADAEALRAARVAYLVPIRREQQLAGFFSLGTKLSDADYERADVDFLQSAAAQVNATLENLRFREEQQEFERAREIQAALLPSRLPQLPGVSLSGSWQPARSVGGDYYDVLELGASKLALTIADVSGKGITAALLMSNLQAAVKLLAFQVADPQRVCEQVNQAICRNVTPGRFITFFYAVLDVAARKLTYCNAGHNPPILSRPGSEPIRLDKGGPLLGFFRDGKFEQEEVELLPRQPPAPVHRWSVGGVQRGRRGIWRGALAGGDE